MYQLGNTGFPAENDAMNKAVLDSLRELRNLHSILTFSKITTLLSTDTIASIPNLPDYMPNGELLVLTSFIVMPVMHVEDLYAYGFSGCRICGGSRSANDVRIYR